MPIKLPIIPSILVLSPELYIAPPTLFVEILFTKSPLITPILPVLNIAPAGAAAIALFAIKLPVISPKTPVLFIAPPVFDLLLIKSAVMLYPFVELLLIAPPLALTSLL